MSYSVCVITGTRAEFGLLKPLIQKLLDDSRLELRLVVTGSHLSAAFGNTQNEILEAGFPVYAQIPIPLDGDSKPDMARATGHAVTVFADFFEQDHPDIVVVLGDRYEIFGAVTAASMQGIPVAHIHGGETTEGAVDEFIRHCITKMSQLHFTACGEYRNRVIQLGEHPDRVFDVGALGVENILHMPRMTLQEVGESLNFPLEGTPFAIVTMHPVTMEDNTAREQMDELIAAMDAFPEMKYIITKANADAGGRIINAIWDAEKGKHPNWIVVPSLGVRRYLSALAHAKMMLGNSSSGIIEAPAMHIPTVNIGDRQKGRMMAESVICCTPEKESIVLAMEKAMSPSFKAITAAAQCPFGNGNTSEKILMELERYLSSEKVQNQKSFFDLFFEV